MQELSCISKNMFFGVTIGTQFVVLGPLSAGMTTNPRYSSSFLKRNPLKITIQFSLNADISTSVLQIKLAVQHVSRG